jgi:hypothetical protein
VRLAAGVRLSVTVTQSNTVGRILMLTIHPRNRRPSAAVQCLAPDSTVPGKDCSTSA